MACHIRCATVTPLIRRRRGSLPPPTSFDDRLRPIGDLRTCLDLIPTIPDPIVALVGRPLRSATRSSIRSLAKLEAKSFESVAVKARRPFDDLHVLFRHRLLRQSGGFEDVVKVGAAAEYLDPHDLPIADLHDRGWVLDAVSLPASDERPGPSRRPPRRDRRVDRSPSGPRAGPPTGFERRQGPRALAWCRLDRDRSIDELDLGIAQRQQLFLVPAIPGVEQAANRSPRSPPTSPTPTARRLRDLLPDPCTAGPISPALRAP